MYNCTPKYRYFLILLLLTVFSAVNGLAQIVIGTPTLGFSQACASAGFNTYNVSFTFFPPANLQAGNQFIVELSDATGGFGTATVVQTLTSATSPVNTNFQLPTNTAGQGYRVRVRSTAPSATSPASVSFPAYYAIHNQPFSINNNAGSITSCEGSTVVLQVDNTGTPASPLFYPGLIYKWYRNFAVVAGATGPTLNVTEAGNYYVIVDYGTCVMNSYSNIITVNTVAGFTLTIDTTDGGDVICAGSSKTLVSSNQNTAYLYQWYRDNVAITGATNATYNATLEGTYKLIITVGSCVFESDEMFLELQDLEVTLDVNATEVLIPGDQLGINSINNGVNVTYQWRRNGVNISGATSSSYTATLSGLYTLVVTETQNCTLVDQASVNVIYPNSFSLVVDTTGDYQSCVSSSTTLEITSFNAITSTSTISILNNNFNYGYQWYKNNQPIAGATALTLPVNQTLGNGNYNLVVTIPNITNPVTSNTITVTLGNAAAPVISQTGTYCNSSSTVTLSSTYSGSQYQYQWYRNAAAISGAISATLSTNQEGSYYVIVTNSGCPVTSNLWNIQAATGTITIENPANDVILPGEQKVLTTTTSLNQPTYQWYRNNILIAGATASSYTATQDGIYKVIATEAGNGCTITAEASVTLVYPTSFVLTINVNSGYQNCVSNSTSLVINSFVAQTSQGNINVNPNNVAFIYQWLLNTNAVAGANNTTHDISNSTQNGTYSLSVTLPNYGVIISNNVSVALAITTPTITAQGSLCNGNTITLSSSETSSLYTYSWYKNGTLIPNSNVANYAASEIGNYYLIVSNGSCSSTSNTIDLQESTYTATLNVPATDVIIPGESKVLQVTTDAVQPTFQWFRNNVLLAGANSSAYTATLNGTYKVIVTQTQGCNSTQEAVVDLIYPDSFTVVIAPSSNYADCANSATQLRITSFNATTSLGTVSILNNDYGYTYQWYRNNNLVVSSNQNTLDITSLTENGSYELRVVVPNFNLIISNIVVIKLGLDIQVTVVADAEFICENGGSTLLTSNANQANYQYNWFRSGTTQSIGSQSELTVTSAGTYYLVVTVSDCTYTSNEVNVNAIDESYVTLSEAENFTVFEGSTKMVYATGGDSYQWFFGDDLVAVGPSYGVSEAGSYLLIAMVGNCEIVKIFNVTIIENNSIVIPNFVSINNDGRNDLWAIPEKYTNKEDVEITIYASSGKVIFRSRNYQNNWPTNTFSYSKKDPVVYYTISENNQITKKGTITIIE
ncbi:gliding motility-associated C-terminal domain-containing protein [Flavobacterium sp.]|jgi:hypothetical protein|uniref:T9SS type B sorting domain-containing protein n=1 Tax=Flavobacterium sp. TaxID=239 RepID=UPI0037C00054